MNISENAKKAAEEIHEGLLKHGMAKELTHLGFCQLIEDKVQQAIDLELDCAKSVIEDRDAEIEQWDIANKALQAELANARNAALEEAARECDAMKQAALTASPSTSSTQMVFELAAGLRDCAARIRSLKKG